MSISLRINQKQITVDVQPDVSLLSLLRSLNYRSVKQGCDTGMCGLCTVWVEGRPVLSCCMPAVRADGHSVTTIEGVQEQARAFGTFLAAEGAEQCGYCSPGFIMTVLAMERELTDPSEEEILHYLNGNLCRCSGYSGQTRAVKAYLRARASRAEPLE